MAFSNIEAGEGYHPDDVRASYLAEDNPVSNNDWETLQHFYDIPEDLTGIPVLDVCAGGSDVTAALAERGAESVAVDRLYGDMNAVHSAVIYNLTFELTDGGEEWDHEIAELYRREILMHEEHPSTVRFRKSVAEEPHRYVKGFAHNLPFSDNSFAFVLSFYGIMGVLHEDPELFKKAIAEALRVLQPGGQIQMGPYNEGQYSRDELSHLRWLVRELSAAEGLSVETAKTGLPSGAERVTITKLPQLQN